MREETNKPLEYLVANLLDFYRDPKEETHFLKAAKLAENLIIRIANRRDFDLEKRFLFFASKLNGNISPESLRLFANECLECSKKFGFFTEKNQSPFNQSERNLHKKAKKELAESLAQGHSHASSVQRAANELFKSKKTMDAKERLRRLAETHPLKDSLEVLTFHGSPLVKEDIKNQFLQLKKPHEKNRQGGGMLLGLLAKAQAFSISRLHGLLGDELFFLCRPVGFLDQNATTLMVEVPTSAHLHALTYKKIDIVRALKQDKMFMALKTVKLKVSQSKIT